MLRFHYWTTRDISRQEKGTKAEAYSAVPLRAYIDTAPKLPKTHDCLNAPSAAKSAAKSTTLPLKARPTPILLCSKNEVGRLSTEAITK